jgi:hypothetical protein
LIQMPECNARRLTMAVHLRAAGRERGRRELLAPASSRQMSCARLCTHQKHGARTRKHTRANVRNCASKPKRALLLRIGVFSALRLRASLSVTLGRPAKFPTRALCIWDMSDSALRTPHIGLNAYRE